MSDKPWQVHKFGGSSLADETCFRRVAGILLATPSARQAVVVSAMGGMTDALLHLVMLAERADDLTLHRPDVGLHLPAVEIRAFVGDEGFEVPHSGRVAPLLA